MSISSLINKFLDLAAPAPADSPSESPDDDESPAVPITPSETDVPSGTIIISNFHFYNIFSTPLDDDHIIKGNTERNRTIRDTFRVYSLHCFISCNVHLD